MVDLTTLPNQIGCYTRRSPKSNAWINGNMIVLITDHSVSFGTAIPVGACFRKAEVSSNEEAIAEVKKGWKKKK